MSTADRMDAAFAALADPTRRAILARLKTGDATVNELVAPFDLSQPAISKHLSVLEKAGLITRGRDGTRRPCRLNAAPLAEIDIWINDYRTHWDARFDRLDALIETMKTKKGED